MLGTLNPLGGGDPIPLLKLRLTIGRRSSCDICLDYPNVSSHHCELEYKNGYWHVMDLGSSNGTKVNGERVVEKFLHPGDTLEVAKHRFDVAYTPDPAAPVPVEANDPFALSLMEKAGLERPPSRRQEKLKLPPSSRPVPPPKPSSDKPDDDDLALEFLKD